MIRVLPVQFTFQPERSVRLPEFAGSLWRSALGARLRRDACITGSPTCTSCRVRATCTYGRVFEPEAGTAAVGLNARFRDLPRPYVISPRHSSGLCTAGQNLRVSVTLVGPAMSELTAFRSAAGRLQLHGVPVRMTRAEVIPPASEEARDESAGGAATGYLIESPPVPPRVRIDLETPLRLRHDNHYVGRDAFSLPAFISTLLRRISSLHDLTARIPMQADFSGIVAHAGERIAVEEAELKWRDQSRRSARQRQRVPMGGLTGRLTLRGDLAPVWSWLWAGQWTHVGKGSVMGHGRYRLQPLS